MGVLRKALAPAITRSSDAGRAPPADFGSMGRRVGLFACALAALVAVTALLPAGSMATRARQSHHSGALAVDLGILQQLNQIRRAHHLVPLALSPNLNAAARQHSGDMLVRGYFAHESADGEPFWKRIKSFYPEPRYGYWSVGENLSGRPAR